MHGTARAAQNSALRWRHSSTRSTPAMRTIYQRTASATLRSIDSGESAAPCYASSTMDAASFKTAAGGSFTSRSGARRQGTHAAVSVARSKSRISRDSLVTLPRPGASFVLSGTHRADVRDDSRSGTPAARRVRTCRAGSPHVVTLRSHAAAAPSARAACADGSRVRHSRSLLTIAIAPVYQFHGLRGDSAGGSCKRLEPGKGTRPALGPKGGELGLDGDREALEADDGEAGGGQGDRALRHRSDHDARDPWTRCAPHGISRSPIRRLRCAGSGL
jgi:hypothetical protein